MSSACVIGRAHQFVTNIHEALADAAESQFEFLVVPLFHPRLRRDGLGHSAARLGPGTRSDRELTTKEWQSNVVGACSEWLNFESHCEQVRRSSEECLMQESSWALHLGLQAIMLPPPSLLSPNYARVVRRICDSQAVGCFQQLWIKIPLYRDLDSRDGTASCTHTSDGWEAWDTFRHLVGHHHRLGVALLISENLPSDNHDEMSSIMSRWSAEPIKAVILSTRLFVNNKSGHPSLRKKFRPLVASLLRFRTHCVLTGPSECTNKFADYVAYLRHFQTRQQASTLDFGEQFTESYRDTLQAPLQPLMDNLEAQTYEVFESDPVKYSKYETATRKALFQLRGDLQGVESTLAREVVITVVGAGRGPLVAAALKAATSLNVPVRVYAVEKNVNAVITLRNRVITENWTNVTVVSGDMRKWVPPELADILISELLGSWGDNELSPECLDGAQACLKQGGISVPCNYESFVAPLSSNKLWMCARDMLDGRGLDSPFVVKLHACYQPAAEQSLFKFEHPNWAPRSDGDNGRFAQLSFSVTCSTTIHGLAGTFESTLFADEVLSIAPHSHTPGLFSWFPLFIPFTTPVRLEAGQTITVCIWRCVSTQKVWYEWCLVRPICTPVQNSGGSSFWVGL